eukprot:GFUD01039866.1.p1 GENE.GFUD01039866.1~~GFUD01039866.1.p1  ORF type:complete len:237 (+),score=84.28 GFUD01039866.1:185-895(+)
MVGVNSDVDNLGICLGKRLGRIEVSSVETVEQLVGLVERCGVVEEALVEEHVARETDEKRIARLEQIISKLNKVISKKEEKKIGEDKDLKNKLAKLEEEQLESKKNFLELVESCQGMEEKVKEIGRIHENLLVEVEDLKKEKETLINSLINNSKLQTNLSSPSSSSSTLSSTSDSQPSSTSGNFVKPTRSGPPPVPLFQTMPPPPLFYPPMYSHHPYHLHPHYPGYPQYPPSSGEQ